jgi:RNA polymerase sigma-70 factor (ECF subfamily)
VNRTAVVRSDVREAVAEAHRREWAMVLAATVRVAGDLDLAEECVQDAYVSALDAWTRDGIPTNPGAWLTVASRRRALDAHRREKTLRTKLPLLIEPDTAPEESTVDGEGVDVIPDDRLRLVFTCCHPALAREAQVALTLRLVCGLTTAEISDAFLVSETTMAARVTRAKKKIQAAHIAYRVPAAADLPERLDAVLTVVHLLFTTGHTAPNGQELVRADLVDRALRLTRMLAQLMPDEREVRGLLALLLLTDARRATRSTSDGRLALLQEQDRSAWDRAAIAEGTALVVGADTPAASPCRPRSPRCTRRRHPTPRPTGTRCAGSMTNCCGSGPRRWSSSTGAWQRPWWTVQPSPWPNWPRWSATNAWPATGTSPPPGPICCVGWAGPTKRPTRTGRPWP